MTSRVAGSPQPRRSAELAGQTCSRGCTRNLLFFLRVLGDFRADGAPPFVRGTWYPRPSAQSDSFAPPWAKGSRGDGGLRKGGRASLTWRSFGTFLSTGREKYTDHTPRQTQIYKFPMFSARNILTFRRFSGKIWIRLSTSRRRLRYLARLPNTPHKGDLL